jgi:hypothetical protein
VRVDRSRARRPGESRHVVSIGLIVAGGDQEADISGTAESVAVLNGRPTLPGRYSPWSCSTSGRNRERNPGSDANSGLTIFTAAWPYRYVPQVDDAHPARAPAVLAGRNPPARRGSPLPSGLAAARYPMARHSSGALRHQELLATVVLCTPSSR